MVRLTPRRTGFTLIEMMLTLVVLGILTTLALPSFSNLVARHRTKSAATDLYVALVKARSEAVKRNAAVTLAPSAGGWQAGWQVLDAGNIVLDAHEAAQGVTINGGPVNVVYQSSGRIVGNAAPVFMVSSLAASSYRQCVSASVSGRPYVKSC